MKEHAFKCPKTSLSPNSFFDPLCTFPQRPCIRSYNTGLSFDPIFMKFTWSVRVHSWVNPIVFGNNRPNRTTDMGENEPPKPVSRVLVRRYGGFCEKKLKNCIWYPIYQKKSYIHFCHPTTRSLKNGDSTQK